MASAVSAQAVVVCPEECSAPIPVPAAYIEFASFEMVNSGSATAGAYLNGLSAPPFVSPSGSAPTITPDGLGGVTITVGPPTGTQIQLRSTLMPVASVFATATRSDLGGAVGNQLALVQSDTRLIYRVTITAKDAAHAATLSAMLDTPLATVTARYTISSSGTAQAFAELRTGIDGQTFTSSQLPRCINGNGDCGSGVMSAPVFFADSTGFTNGHALDFHSQIELDANALGGAFALNSGTGSASVFIDPVVTLVVGLDPNQYQLVVADGLVSNLAAPVPEPATWAALLSGLLLLGGLGSWRTRNAQAWQL